MNFTQSIDSAGMCQSRIKVEYISLTCSTRSPFFCDVGNACRITFICFCNCRRSPCRYTVFSFAISGLVSAASRAFQCALWISDMGYASDLGNVKVTSSTQLSWMFRRILAHQRAATGADVLPSRLIIFSTQPDVIVRRTWRKRLISGRVLHCRESVGSGVRKFKLQRSTRNRLNGSHGSLPRSSN